VRGGPRRAEILLLVGSVAVFAAAAEGTVRLLGVAAPRPTGYAPVDTKRRAMQPRNSQGYRDRERALAKPRGVRRVVARGDSFAWGASVEFEDAWPQRLERGLVRRRREPWEVVNLALPGMNTVDHAAQLADEGVSYGPDVVLVGYVLNDSEDSQAAEARRAVDWSQPRERRGLMDRSALLRLVRNRLWATAENRRRVSGYKSMYSAEAPGWASARKALKTMGALCRGRAVPLVVAIFPLFGNPMGDDYPFAAIHAKVGEAAAEAGARVVDLLPAYRGLRWELLVVDGVDDEHPNEIAHRIAAGVILHALDGVVPWSTGGAARAEGDGGGPPS
jgi:hypothetical protein